MTDTAKILPKLRFPEFENDGKWKVVKLGDVVTFCNSKCDRSELKIETYISTENILQDFLGVKRAVNLPQNGSFTKFCIGDILVSNIRPYLKKIWQADFDGAASNDVLVFRTKNQNNDKYVAHLLKSDAFVNYCMEGAKGVKMPRGDKALMLEYSIPFPTLPEQQKIASFLTSLDEQISAHTKKLEALKAHKKGLMQQLFPANGEKTPKLRFPEFKNAGEWEEDLIKNKCSIGTGKSNSQDQDTNGKYPFFIRSATPVKSNKYLYDCEAVITIGDGQIGKVFHYVNGKFDLHQRCYKMCDFKGIEGKFFFYFFSTHFYERAMRMTAKATVDSVRLEMISEMPISFPTLPEQQKIASFLTSIDDMIQAKDDKIRKLKTYKNGLMQQMFAK
ncbi:MAG: restriction endonuclease subunit S [Bacteroidales bacterium]|nr:restriction endonuclease subunit S [Bacteroidales bacterium]